MIRFSVIKLAQRLGTRGQIAGLEAIEGKVDWMAAESWGDTAVAKFMERNSRRQSPSFDLASIGEDVDVVE